MEAISNGTAKLVEWPEGVSITEILDVKKNKPVILDKAAIKDIREQRDYLNRKGRKKELQTLLNTISQAREKIGQYPEAYRAET